MIFINAIHIRRKANIKYTTFDTSTHICLKYICILNASPLYHPGWMSIVTRAVITPRRAHIICIAVCIAVITFCTVSVEFVEGVGDAGVAAKAVSLKKKNIPNTLMAKRRFLRLQYFCKERSFIIICFYFCNYWNNHNIYIFLLQIFGRYKKWPLFCLKPFFNICFSYSFFLRSSVNILGFPAHAESFIHCPTKYPNILSFQAL